MQETRNVPMIIRVLPLPQVPPRSLQIEVFRAISRKITVLARIHKSGISTTARRDNVKSLRMAAAAATRTTSIV